MRTAAARLSTITSRRLVRCRSAAAVAVGMTRSSGSGSGSGGGSGGGTGGDEVKTGEAKLISPSTQAEQFTLGSLRRTSLEATPTTQFQNWFATARASTAHAETCVLATSSLPSGHVSARVVYLKEVDADGGFVLYSNWASSRKAADVASNPNVALVFYWESLQRQVRVEGQALRVSREQSQAYFDTRLRGSRIGAWASRQTSVLEPDDAVQGDDGRLALERAVEETESRFDGLQQIPVPDFWGGLRVQPRTVEFWQGRDNRLHDRFLYEWHEPDATWTIKRLSP
ncbi:hypothetical protein XA68_16892 [Ophiocordyceps unilateralis]|uniref:pyridoxal 5'-phosphate synthase n=1 Tax=Ophiocordyceps unilateralis TaxID=268505 RepID=A0A2A9P4V9_OPHUN|nr:hypothetical protein XA68_16892 [Ophiocordyceps unilateralis]